MATAWQTYDAEKANAAASVEQEWLDSRKSLRLAGNNLPIPPSDRAAARIHRAMKDHDSRLALGIITLQFANVDDGMAWHELMRPLRRIESLTSVRFLARQRSKVIPFADLPVRTLFKREQRTNYQFDAQQFRVVETDESDVQALRDGIIAGRAQIAATEDAVKAMEQRLAALTLAGVGQPNYTTPTLRVM